MTWRRRTQNLDPHWITKKFEPGECSRCKAKIRIGERAFYYPNGRTFLCMNDGCGVKASQEFNEALFDERQMAGGY